jgi:hypothetical protein
VVNLTGFEIKDEVRKDGVKNAKNDLFFLSLEEKYNN